MVVWQKYGLGPRQLCWKDGEHEPPGPQSESTTQLPPRTQMFALLSADELRQRQVASGPQSESVKHSSYEQPPGPTRPAKGKQRPFAPAVHCESDVQVEATPDGYGCPAGPGERSEGQQAALGRWKTGARGSASEVVAPSSEVD
jgi:hypothetical protein